MYSDYSEEGFASIFSLTVWERDIEWLALLRSREPWKGSIQPVTYSLFHYKSNDFDTLFQGGMRRRNPSKSQERWKREWRCTVVWKAFHVALLMSPHRKLNFTIPSSTRFSKISLQVDQAFSSDRFCRETSIYSYGKYLLTFDAVQNISTCKTRKQEIRVVLNFIWP